MRRLVTLLVLAQLAGCTLVFPTIGGISAASSNSTARAQHRPETASVGSRILVGLIVGLFVDAILLIKLSDNFEHQPEG